MICRIHRIYLQSNVAASGSPSSVAVVVVVAVVGVAVAPQYPKHQDESCAAGAGGGAIAQTKKFRACKSLLYEMCESSPLQRSFVMLQRRLCNVNCAPAMLSFAGCCGTVGSGLHTECLG